MQSIFKSVVIGLPGYFTKKETIELVARLDHVQLRLLHMVSFRTDHSNAYLPPGEVDAGDQPGLEDHIHRCPLECFGRDPKDRLPLNLLFFLLEEQLVDSICKCNVCLLCLLVCKQTD